LGTRNLSEAWLTIEVFTLALVYSVLYQGHWPAIRDYVNILDKENWGLFAVYSIIVWALALMVMPGIVYLLSYIGTKFSKIQMNVREVFKGLSGALLPIGLFLWISFVIPMLFVNLTFVLQSFSDPFGWGWDFFGTASIPWHQFMPRLVPWLQAILILTGLYYSLRNLKKTWLNKKIKSVVLLRLILPMGLFLTLAGVVLLIFFTN
jgi:hypothetical protein